MHPRRRLGRADAEVHGWDLGKGLGEPAAVDEATASYLLPGVRSQAELLQASGLFDEPMDVGADAPDGATLLRLLGRRPD